MTDHAEDPMEDPEFQLMHDIHTLGTAVRNLSIWPPEKLLEYLGVLQADHDGLTGLIQKIRKRAA